MKTAAKTLTTGTFILGLTLSSLNALGQEVDEQRQSLRIPQAKEVIDHHSRESGTEIGVLSTDDKKPEERLLFLPMPSYEPGFGWGIELFTGRFLDLDKENPETQPSSIGVFASISENVYVVRTFWTASSLI